jgi:hypothetical protein
MNPDVIDTYDPIKANTNGRKQMRVYEGQNQHTGLVVPGCRPPHLFWTIDTIVEIGCIFSIVRRIGDEALNRIKMETCLIW